MGRPRAVLNLHLCVHARGALGARAHAGPVSSGVEMKTLPVKPPKTAWDVPFFSDAHLYPPSRRICRSDAGRGAKDAEFRDRSASNVCPIATLRGLLL